MEYNIFLLCHLEAGKDRFRVTLRRPGETFAFQAEFQNGDDLREQEAAASGMVEIADDEIPRSRRRNVIGRNDLRDRQPAFALPRPTLNGPRSGLRSSDQSGGSAAVDRRAFMRLPVWRPA